MIRWLNGIVLGVFRRLSTVPANDSDNLFKFRHMAVACPSCGAMDAAGEAHYEDCSVLEDELEVSND